MTYNSQWPTPARVALLISFVCIVLLSYSHWLDDLATDFTARGFERSLITYGVSRGLNGVISVAQGTEVAIEPVGVGMTFTPGQILDPVNDLVERFSLVVLASSASLGLQRLLIVMTSWYGLNLLLAAALAMSLIVVWYPRVAGCWLRQAILRVAMILLIIRFIVPVAALTNEGVYLAFLEESYQSSSTDLKLTVDEAQQISADEQPPVVTTGLWERIEKLYDSAADSVDLQRHIDQLKETVADITEDIVQLIVVFIMQTLIIPLFFIWLAFRLIRGALTMNLSEVVTWPEKH